MIIVYVKTIDNKRYLKQESDKEENWTKGMNSRVY